MRLVERWEGGECTPVMKSDIDKNVHKEKCHEIKLDTKSKCYLEK